MEVLEEEGAVRTSTLRDVRVGEGHAIAGGVEAAVSDVHATPDSGSLERLHTTAKTTSSSHASDNGQLYSHLLARRIRVGLVGILEILEGGGVGHDGLLL